MKVLLILAVVVALVFPAATAAHPGGWYWTRTAAENYLIDRAATSDGEAITDATCTGMGRPWKRPGRWLYHHLRCDENDDLDREFIVVVHPTSRYHAAVVETSCDDSYSEYTCP